MKNVRPSGTPERRGFDACAEFVRLAHQSWVALTALEIAHVRALNTKKGSGPHGH
jgi:hypothetical protein